MRRAGSPVHASRGPRIAKSTPAACEQLRGRPRGLARALVVRRRAADPVEDSGARVAGLEHAHVEALRPGGALGLRLAPRVATGARRRAASARPRGEARLDHHQVAAQVDDVVDVLDVDRALAHAGAAGDAVPDDLLELRASATSGRRRLPSSPGERLRALREEVVADAHDQQLRRQRLVGRVGRAGVLAAAALRARERVHHLLPGQVLDRPDAEAHVLLGRLLVEPQRLEPAARARAAEVDVDRRGDDVQVLGVRQVGEEAEDEQHVRPHETRSAPRCLPSPNRSRAFATGDQRRHSLSPSAMRGVHSSSVIRSR